MNINDVELYEIDVFLKITNQEEKSAYDIIEEHIKVTKSNPKGYTWWGNNQPYLPEKVEGFRKKGYVPRALIVVPSTSGGTDNIEYIADILDSVRDINKCFPEDDYRPQYYMDVEHKVWIKLANFRKVNSNDMDISQYYILSNDEQLVDKMKSQYACGYVYRLKPDEKDEVIQYADTDILLKEREEQYLNEIGDSIEDISKMADTEKDILIKTRIGHGKLKKELLKKEERCILCGLSDEKFLIASHIKPWSVSNSQERLDIENVLLLCPHHDSVFDKGYIAFDEEGGLLISSELSLQSRVLLNLHAEKKISLNPKRKEYLEWHRKNLFKE